LWFLTTFMILCYLFLTGLRALSLTKQQAVTLAPSWSHGLVAAFEPYLISVNETALLLWDRRTLTLVLSVPATGVQGVVAFVGSELQEGKSSSTLDGAGWPVLLQARVPPGCWGLFLEVPEVWAGDSPKSRLMFQCLCLCQCQQAKDLPCHSLHL